MITIEVVSETQTLNVLGNPQPLIAGSILSQTIFVPPSQTISVNPVTLQTLVSEIRNSVIQSLPAGPTGLLMSSVPAVTVVNSGPPGPSSSPSHPAQEAFHKANGLEERTISYTDGLPSIIRYYKENVLQYTSTITYVNDLPSFVTLVNQVNQAAFVKVILYENDLPIGVEWQTI